MRAGLALIFAVILTSAPWARAETFPDSEATDHIGETATIEGIVKGTPVTENHTQFLDFGDVYPDQDFSAVIWAPDAGKFMDVSLYYGRRVAVTGKITLYRKKPEMVLISADQLKVLP